eukprot:scaffold1939_cov392-Prasinococcus_capsulatus_cf.AAC.7
MKRLPRCSRGDGEERRLRGPLPKKDGLRSSSLSIRQTRPRTTTVPMSLDADRGRAPFPKYGASRGVPGRLSERMLCREERLWMWVASDKLRASWARLR